MPTKKASKAAKGIRSVGRRRNAKKQPTATQLAPGDQPDEIYILAVSDIRSQPLDDLLRYVDLLEHRPDLIVCAGDDVKRFVPNGGLNYFEALAHFSRYGLVAVAGNDDGPEASTLIVGKGVYEVHHGPVLIGDVLVLGLEGAPFREDLPAMGSLAYSESEITKHLSRALERFAAGPVLVVSHAPPYQVLDLAQRHGVRSIGSQALREIVLKDDRIEVVICGHCHRDGGKSADLGGAVVVNAATHDGPDDFIRVAKYSWQRGTPKTPEFEVLYPELRCLYGIHSGDIPKLRGAGITTLEQLAEVSPEELPGILGRSDVQQFPVLAEAKLKGKPLPIAPLYGPPAPRVFFDIETDPDGGNKLCWLIGTLDEGTGEFSQFVAPHPAAERELLQEFVNYCKRLGFRTFVGYSGSKFDNSILCTTNVHRYLDLANESSALSRPRSSAHRRMPPSTSARPCPKWKQLSYAAYRRDDSVASALRGHPCRSEKSGALSLCTLSDLCRSTIHRPACSGLTFLVGASASSRCFVRTIRRRARIRKGLLELKLHRI